MSHLEYATRVNNEAVSHLLAGNDNIAVESLTKSVSLMKRVLAKASSQGSSTSSSSTSEKSSLSCISTTGSPSDYQEISIHHASEPLSSLTDRQCYIYNHALSITFDESYVNIEKDAQVLCSVVIFNLALAYHRRGRTERSKICTERSVMLYNMILRLLRHTAISGTAGVVKLAAMNNLSQIRFEQGNYVQARRGLDHISSLIQGRHALKPQFDQCELRGLIMNVLFMTAPQVAPAA